MPPFFNGIVFGLIFIFSLGPAFFALIQTSIQRGFRKAVFLAIGISLSDVIYVMITLLGMAAFLKTDDFKFWMAIFGSGMLTGYAIYSWVKEPKLEELEVEKDSNFWKYILKGLLLNGLNPFIIVSWATWISAIAINFDYQFAQQMQFFVGMLLSILSLDIGKAFLADKVKHLITRRFVLIMNRTVAIVILLFTLRIFFFLYENYYA